MLDPDVLEGPGGGRVDVAACVTRALDPAHGWGELRALLAGRRAAPARDLRHRRAGGWTLSRRGGVGDGPEVAEALVIEGLRKRYGPTVAVDGVNLTVAEGEIVGIVGPNGSGKTTTVETAYGLRRADSGRIRVFGVDPRGQPDRVARLVGCQLQDSALPDRIRAGEAVRLFAALAGCRVDEAAVLARWGLAGKRRTSYASLSGGQRQRLLVALALVGAPRLLFLDEMTTGLDPVARRDVWQVVERVRAAGATVVLVTHFMDEARRLCDRIAVLVSGRVVAEGTPAGLIDRYGGGTRVRFAAPPGLDPGVLARLPGVRSVASSGAGGGWIEVSGSGAFLTAVGHALTVAGHPSVEMRVSQASLEDAYLRLTAPAWPGGAGAVDKDVRHADPETDVETDPDTDPETDPDTDPETDPETDPDTDPETDPEADPGNAATGRVDPGEAGR